MRHYIFVILLVIVCLAGYGQIPTPYYTPPSDTIKSKGIKNAVVNPTGKSRIPQIEKILIKYPDKYINISFMYSEDKMISKVTYVYSTGMKYTDHLFYDDKKQLYMIVNESVNTRTGADIKKEFTIISYTVPASKVMSVSTFNTMNQRLTRKSFSYNGDSVLYSYRNEVTGVHANSWIVRTAGGRNVLKRKEGVRILESLNFLNSADPTSLLPEAYSTIYLNDKEFVWYVFEGSKDLPYKMRILDNGELLNTSIVYLHEKNIHGWIKHIYRTPETGGLGTEFRFYYLNE